jgi:hypothetical protein
VRNGGRERSGARLNTGIALGGDRVAAQPEKRWLRRVDRAWKNESDRRLQRPLAARVVLVQNDCGIRWCTVNANATAEKLRRLRPARR